MPADIYFALTLIAKMAITAGFVLAATVAAERAGPLVGALVATLPLGAGPVYVFLALDHDTHFIAQSAVKHRDKDRTHLRDLLELGIIDATWVPLYPAELGGRLQGLIDTPGG